ncbi:MAG TPA: hypothetical protein VH109_13335 [Steroidobacteraceae bacterium]|jgi:hypothetical protein|nr:hypothetical protein [Steroidobacteraceae bacterium]
MKPEKPDHGPPDPRRAGAVGLVIALIVVVLGLLLVRVLGNAGRLQDCVMSGRSNCAPLETGPDH